MLSKRFKNVARSLDWIQLHRFWSSAGLAPRNTGGLTEPLQSQSSPRRAANTWVCLLFSNKYFPIYFTFKTTKDKAYSAVKMNLCLDSVDFCIFLSKREKRKNLWTGGSQAAIIKVQTTLSYWWCSTGISAHSHDLEYYSNRESGFLIWPLLKAPDTYYIIFQNLYSATLSFLIWPRCYKLCFRHKC